MKNAHLFVLTLALGCGGDSDFDQASCESVSGTCQQFLSTQVQALLEAANTVTDNTTLILARGTFAMDNQLTLRNVSGITIRGQGMDATILSFKDQAAQSNGIDAVVDDFTLENLAVTDAKKDAVRVEDSNNVILRGVRTTWSGGPSSSNGAYGLYPVKSSNVLIENCEAFNSADAGIYVGQSQNVIVRNNRAERNVAGIEIENTQFADVYGNTAVNNTGGLLIFDLPGNPIPGRDIKMHNNIITDNNHENFAAGGVVRSIPAGVGTFAIASRRVEIHDNTYARNNTTDIAVFSGLSIDSDASRWTIPKTRAVGNIEDLELMDDGGDNWFNFRAEKIYIHDNSHEGSGTQADGSDPANRQLGFLTYVVYTDAGHTIENIVYDSIGENAFDANDAASNSNDNRLCVRNESSATFASLNLGELSQSLSYESIFRPMAPFPPFGCEGTSISTVTLAF